MLAEALNAVLRGLRGNTMKQGVGPRGLVYTPLKLRGLLESGIWASGTVSKFVEFLRQAVKPRPAVDEMSAQNPDFG